MLLQQQLNIDALNAASDWDCSGLFLSESRLCFVDFKYILNRVNLNEANTNHLIKYTVKCFRLCVVNLLLCSTRKSLKINLGWQCKEVIPLLGQTILLGWNENSYSDNLACFNYFCARSCQNAEKFGLGGVITTTALSFNFLFIS